jgi:hypothetical protein
VSAVLSWLRPSGSAVHLGSTFVFPFSQLLVTKTLPRSVSASAVVATLFIRFALVRRVLGAGAKDSYLVDPASSHMLVSKIKPCMSKYKQLVQ